MTALSNPDECIEQNIAVLMLLFLDGKKPDDGTYPRTYKYI